MKGILTLIIASLIVVSAMGQAAKKSIMNHNRQNGIEVFEHFKTRAIGHGSNRSTDYADKSQPILKSAQVLKQRLDSIINEEYDNTTSEWMASYKVVFIYNSSGNMTHEIEYYPNGNLNQWEADSVKYEYIYDANKNVTQEVVFSWHPDENLWMADYKDEYTYDSNGNRVQHSVYTWYNSSNQWVFGYKDEYIYDTNGNVIQILEYGSLIDNSHADYKDDYSYDAYGNMVQDIMYEWITETNEWILNYKTDITYNNSFTFNELLFPFLDNIYFEHMPLSYVDYEWNNIEDKWIINGKATFFYSEVNITGISNIPANELKTFPNPAKESVTFNMKDASQAASIELFDIQGKKVISQLLPFNKQISVSQLNCGIYFYKINQGGKMYYGKIMIK